MRVWTGLALVTIAACSGPSSPGDSDAADAPAIDGPDLDAPAIDASIDDAAIDAAVDAAIDAPLADAAVDGAMLADPCVVEHAFTYLAPGQATQGLATVPTDTGWLVAYETQPYDAAEVWWTLVSASGQILAGPTRAPGSAIARSPRVARTGDHLLLVYLEEPTWWAQPITSLGAPAGPRVALAPPSAPMGAISRVAALVPDGAAGFRAIWTYAEASTFPPTIDRGGVAVAHLGVTGAQLAVGPTTVTQPALGLHLAEPRADGSIAVTTSRRAQLFTCLTCTAGGHGRISASDVFTDLGVIPQPMDARKQVTSIAPDGARLYTTRVASQATLPTPRPVGTFTYFNDETVLATFPDTLLLIAAVTGPGRGAIASWYDLTRLRGFTDGVAFTLGDTCELDVFPYAIHAVDADTVVVMGRGIGRIATVP